MKRSHYQKYVKLHKSVKLSFTNIRGLRSNFVGCESFLESNPPDILALYESKVEDSVDSNKLSVRGCSEGFCISAHLLICLSLETLTSIKRTD